MAVARPEEIFLFWKDAGPEKWFVADPAFDETVRARFLETYEAGMRGELEHWERSAYGAFALVILLDQFPRNMFRGTPKAFASDEKAKQIAGRAISAGRDKAIDPEVHTFFYMPYMQSRVSAGSRTGTRFSGASRRPKRSPISMAAASRADRSPIS